MKKEVSCGAIIIDDNQVLMIKQVNEETSYGFPKGHIEPGETEKETAIREVKEETNLDIIITSEKKYTTNYIIKDNILKEVNLYLATVVGIKPLIKQDKEISDIKWVDIDKVADLITYENTRQLWYKVYENIKSKIN